MSYKLIFTFLVLLLASCGGNESDQNEQKYLEEPAEDFEDMQDRDDIDNDAYKDTTENIAPDEIILEDAARLENE